MADDREVREMAVKSGGGAIRLAMREAEKSGAAAAARWRARCAALLPAPGRVPGRAPVVREKGAMEVGNKMLKDSRKEVTDASMPAPGMLGAGGALARSSAREREYC